MKNLISFSLLIIVSLFVFFACEKTDTVEKGKYILQLNNSIENGKVYYSADKVHWVELTSEKIIVEQGAYYFKAVPNEGYRLENWSNPQLGTDIITQSFNLRQNTILGPIFNIMEEKYSIVLDQTIERGTIKYSVDSTEWKPLQEPIEILAGEKIWFVAVPDQGKFFYQWISGGTGVNDTTNAIVVNQRLIVKAEFKDTPPIVRTIIFENNQPGIRQNGKVQYSTSDGRLWGTTDKLQINEGVRVFFRAIPNDYYDFEMWQNPSELSELTEPVDDVTVNRDFTVTAKFVIKTFKVDFVAIPNATIQYKKENDTEYQNVPTEGVEFEALTNLSFKVVPDGLFQFEKWTGDLLGLLYLNNANETTNPTVAMPLKSNITLQATLKKHTISSPAAAEYTIQYSVNGGMEYQPIPDAGLALEVGTSIGFKMVPAEGYIFKVWTGDLLGNLYLNNANTTTNPTAAFPLQSNITPKAEWIKQHKVTIAPPATDAGNLTYTINGGTTATTETTVDSPIVISVDDGKSVTLKSASNVSADTYYRFGSFENLSNPTISNNRGEITFTPTTNINTGVNFVRQYKLSITDNIGTGGASITITGQGTDTAGEQTADLTISNTSSSAFFDSNAEVTISVVPMTSDPYYRVNLIADRAPTWGNTSATATVKFQPTADEMINATFIRQWRVTGLPSANPFQGVKYFFEAESGSSIPGGKEDFPSISDIAERTMYVDNNTPVTIGTSEEGVLLEEYKFNNSTISVSSTEEPTQTITANSEIQLTQVAMRTAADGTYTLDYITGNQSNHDLRNANISITITSGVPTAVVITNQSSHTANTFTPSLETGSYSGTTGGNTYTIKIEIRKSNNITVTVAKSGVNGETIWTKRG